MPSGKSRSSSLAGVSPRAPLLAAPIVTAEISKERKVLFLKGQHVIVISYERMANESLKSCGLAEKPGGEEFSPSVDPHRCLTDM